MENKRYISNKNYAKNTTNAVSNVIYDNCFCNNNIREIERRKNKESRSAKVTRDKIKLCIILTLIIVISTLITFTIFSSAHDNSAYDNDPLTYKSTLIEEGESLWSLAMKSSENRLESTEEIVNEIMQINDLKNDKIFEGQYLIVAYLE